MFATLWGMPQEALSIIHKEASINLEAVISRLLRYNTEEMDDLAENLFDSYT